MSSSKSGERCGGGGVNVGRETDSLCLFILYVDQNKQRKKGRALFYVYDPSLWRRGGGGLLPCPRKRENIRIILAVSALTRHFHFQGSYTLDLGFFQSVAYAAPKDYQTFQAAASTIQAAAVTFPVASSSFKQRQFNFMWLRPLHFKLQPLFQTVTSPF